MTRTFAAPAITTRNEVGVVALDYSFQLNAEFDPRRISPGPRGGRVYRAILKGSIAGPRLNGTVYDHSGGDYGVVRADGVEDVHARFMIRDTKGEWIYVEHGGYRRPDGYQVLHATFDADAGGPYAWLNDAVMLAHVDEAEDGRHATFTYYQAI